MELANIFSPKAHHSPSQPLVLLFITLHFRVILHSQIPNKRHSHCEMAALSCEQGTFYGMRTCSTSAGNRHVGIDLMSLNDLESVRVCQSIDFEIANKF
jgi:hypothetical protein